MLFGGLAKAEGCCLTSARVCLASWVMRDLCGVSPRLIGARGVRSLAPAGLLQEFSGWKLPPGFVMLPASLLSVCGCDGRTHPEQKKGTPRALRSNNATSLQKHETMVTENPASVQDFRSNFQGGESSNTPPSISNKVAGGEDTVTLCLGVKWGASFSNLMSALGLAKQQAQEENQPSAFEYGGLSFSVAASGYSAGGYVAYQLAANGVRYGISESAGPFGETPNVYVYMGSSVLMYNDGVEVVWSHVQKVIACLGGEILWDKVSRVDLCVDLHNIEVRRLHEQFRAGCVTRAKHKATYEWGLHLSGFVLGKGAIQLRVYDKKLESEKNPTKWDILQARRLPADWAGDVCTRVEYQVRREMLKEHGIDSLLDYLAVRGSLAEYLCLNWARICEPITDRTHTTRAAITVEWEQVRRAFASWTGPGAPMSRVFRDVVYNGEALAKQALGCLARIVASRAEGEIYEIDQYIQVLRAVIGEVVFKVDIAEQQEKALLSFGAWDPDLGVKSWEERGIFCA